MVQTLSAPGVPTTPDIVLATANILKSITSNALSISGGLSSATVSSLVNCVAFNTAAYADLEETINSAAAATSNALLTSVNQLGNVLSASLPALGGTTSCVSSDNSTAFTAVRADPTSLSSVITHGFSYSDSGGSLGNALASAAGVLSAPKVDARIFTSLNSPYYSFIPDTASV